MKKLYLSFTLIILVAGCNKNTIEENDSQPPVITINTPVASQIFSGGESINITGSITDDKDIAEVHIHVSNTVTGTLLMDVHIYPAINTTSFSQSITAVSGINYKILVTAKDKAINEGKSSVEVSTN